MKTDKKHNKITKAESKFKKRKYIETLIKIFIKTDK